MTVDELREMLAEFPGYRPVTLRIYAPGWYDDGRDLEVVREVQSVTTAGLTDLSVEISS